MLEHHCAAMHTRPAQVDAIGEEGLAAYLNQFRHDIGDRADLAVAPDLHPCEPQPHRPEERAAQPFAR